jgi:hypothetical protein
MPSGSRMLLLAPTRDMLSTFCNVLYAHFHQCAEIESLCTTSVGKRLVGGGEREGTLGVGGGAFMAAHHWRQDNGTK